MCSLLRVVCCQQLVKTLRINNLIETNNPRENKQTRAALPDEDACVLFVQLQLHRGSKQFCLKTNIEFTQNIYSNASSDAGHPSQAAVRQKLTIFEFARQFDGRDGWQLVVDPNKWQIEIGQGLRGF